MSRRTAENPATFVERMPENGLPHGSGDRPAGPSGRRSWWMPAAGAALALYGLRRGSLGGVVLALAGGTLVYQGTRRGRAETIEVHRSVTVNRSREELYRLWRNFANLPRFMRHLEAVTVLDGRRSHWVARAPAGTSVAWDAELIADEENHLIGWRSLESAQVENAGTVRFEALPDDRGTVVSVTLRYRPPGGAAGTAFARLFGEAPGQQIAEDLRRFKQIVEAGEVATTEGQPAGPRRHKGRVQDQARLLTHLMEASGIASPGG